MRVCFKLINDDFIPKQKSAPRAGGGGGGGDYLVQLGGTRGHPKLQQQQKI